MTTTAIKTVRDIPENFHLVQDSQEIQAVAEHFPGIDFDYGCLFVEVNDGDYTAIYGCESFIPYLSAKVDKLL